MTAVPALERGFEVLRVLNQNPGMSLEQIAAQTTLPKASILRLLSTLLELGVIYKDAVSKRYTALASLIDNQQDFAQKIKHLLQHLLQQLATDSDACVEWYEIDEIDELGMRMIQRFSAPENEVQVSARIGFIRSWQGELDSIAVVAQAFMNCPSEEKKPQKYWVYDSKGEQEDVSLQQRKELLTNAAQEQFHCDPHYNTNGVRRMAVPIMCEGRCMGIAALAMSFRPQLEKEIPLKKQKLLQILKKFEGYSA